MIPVRIPLVSSESESAQSSQELVCHFNFSNLGRRIPSLDIDRDDIAKSLNESEKFVV